VVEALLDDVDAGRSHNVWITRLSRDRVLAYATALDPGDRDTLPLFGVPFVLKDNIDLAGVPTTAGCPDFSYVPTRTSPVVQRLIDAGAIPLGKTNLDQFATGLVGTRSPYAACRNSVDPRYISGGSSAGSAVAVALGLASFALGTDTAGSGRVPAAFNNLIGLKPTNGRLSTTGVVPACRSLDCVSIFALTAEDAGIVLGAAEGFDAADPYSQTIPERALRGRRCGVPRADQLEFYGDAEYARLFAGAVARFEKLGGSIVPIDFSPFLDTARLLYDGPWLAERYAAVGSFLQSHPGAIHPVTREVIEAGNRPSAVDAFNGIYQLQALKRRCESVWASIDLLMTPTAGTIYTIEAVDADPFRLNANLGYYTNFMNLLGYTGVAVPAGVRSDGLPFGVTLVAPGGAERALLALAANLHRASGATLGALGRPLAEVSDTAPPLRNGYVPLAVCGAHMSGLPLNHQLQERGGYLLQAAHSAARYRLYALPGGPPFRPGMVRVSDGGAAIALEVWALPTEQVGSFVAGIPAPLGVGKIELESGALVTGFICETYATANATDITRFGGWRAYMAAQ
jgi:allophanate hydrolase